MNKKSYFILLASFLFIFLSATTAKAQDHLYGLALSGQYQKGFMGKVGLFYERGSHTFYKIDANVNMGYMHDRLRAIPELGFTYFFDAFTMAEVEATPYTITPKVGLTFFTLVDFSVGYGISINDNAFKPFKGFTASIGVNIPFNLKDVKF